MLARRGALPEQMRSPQPTSVQGRRPRRELPRTSNAMPAGRLVFGASLPTQGSEDCMPHAGYSPNALFVMLQVHPLRDCPERVVWCKWGCKKKGLLAKHKEEHETTFAVCPNREVVCRLGCGMLTLGRTVKHHEERECRKTFQQCPLDGCTKTVDQRIQMLPQHMDECGFREVKCDVCGQDVVFNSLQAHQDDTCPERRRPCKFGCGAVVYAPRALEVCSGGGALLVARVSRSRAARRVNLPQGGDRVY